MWRSRYIWPLLRLSCRRDRTAAVQLLTLCMFNDTKALQLSSILWWHVTGRITSWAPTVWNLKSDPSSLLAPPPPPPAIPPHFLPWQLTYWKRRCRLITSVGLWDYETQVLSSPDPGHRTHSAGYLITPVDTIHIWLLFSQPWYFRLSFCVGGGIELYDFLSCAMWYVSQMRLQTTFWKPSETALDRHTTQTWSL